MKHFSGCGVKTAEVLWVLVLALGLCFAGPGLSHGGVAGAVVDKILEPTSKEMLEFRKAACEEKGKADGKVGSKTKGRTWFDKAPYTYPPTGETWMRENVCQWTLKDGRVLFEDGCSLQAPADIQKIAGFTERATWGVLFHDACVQHNFCYHHNPITYGLSQANCDEEFKKNLLITCEELFSESGLDDLANRKLCERAGEAMYQGVRVLGKHYYNEFNIQTEYKDLVEGGVLSATGTNCPPLYRRIETYRNKPVCEVFDVPVVPISEAKCVARGGTLIPASGAGTSGNNARKPGAGDKSAGISGKNARKPGSDDQSAGSCYLSMYSGWYNSRPIRAACPVGYDQEGEYNGKPKCRSKVPLRITETNCRKEKGDIVGDDCYLSEKDSWYRVRPLTSERCPLTNPIEIGTHEGLPVCQALLKINEKNCKKEGGFISRGHCFLLQDKGWYKARPLK